MDSERGRETAPAPVELGTQTEAVGNLPNAGLNPFLTALQDKRKLAIYLAEQYDAVCQALSKLGQLNDKLAALSREIEVHRRSVAAFVGQAVGL